MMVNAAGSAALTAFCSSTICFVLHTLIRTQVSAGHSKEDLDFAVRCFAEVKAEMGL